MNLKRNYHVILKKNICQRNYANTCCYYYYYHYYYHQHKGSKSSNVHMKYIQSCLSLIVPTVILRHILFYSVAGTERENCSIVLKIELYYICISLSAVVSYMNILYSGPMATHFNSQNTPEYQSQFKQSCFKVYKATSDKLENCKIMNCIVLRIILNYQTFIIKHWMSSVYV